MFSMILKMSFCTLIGVAIIIVLWFWTKDKPLTTSKKIFIGLIFGGSSILSTHYGVRYSDMILNVRDIAPLAAGLFFSPSSGIIAGLIGGVERYIVGTYFGISPYTRIACSVSTCLAGFVAMAMRIKVFKGKKPSPFYAFFMGAVMEVFHMYVVFVTHRSDMRMAFLVVSTCAIPMMIFTGIGLAVASIILQVFSGEWKNPLKKTDEEQIPLSQKFQSWLFVVTSIVIIGSFIFSYVLQTQSANQDARAMLIDNAEDVERGYNNREANIQSDTNVSFTILNENGRSIRGENPGTVFPSEEYTFLQNSNEDITKGTFWGVKSLIYKKQLLDGNLLIMAMNEEEVYWYRDAEAYEMGLAYILLFTVIYVLIAFLVNQIVVNNIQLINASLTKITNGNLNEVVTVRSSSEFASLSDDINSTVLALKGYIEAAEKRIEQELLLARTIQISALPQTFTFVDRTEFDLYASMKPAKEVGGDFYDFFFVDRDKMALVIADVSGKGIPAALFMMRSKTAIRSYAESGGSPKEIMEKANNTLCEGNDAEMFVTAWIGIIDLSKGDMVCANAGHEYPVIKRANGEYELLKDKHSLALAAMPDTIAREYELKLEPGDKLFVYTDGVPEAINEAVEQFGTDRMIETLNSVASSKMEETIQHVSQTLNEFKGEADQFDDITMLGFEYIG